MGNCNLLRCYAKILWGIHSFRLSTVAMKEHPWLYWTKICHSILGIFKPLQRPNSIKNLHLFSFYSSHYHQTSNPFHWEHQQNCRYLCIQDNCWSIHLKQLLHLSKIDLKFQLLCFLIFFLSFHWSFSSKLYDWCEIRSKSILPLTSYFNQPFYYFCWSH